MNPFSRFKNYFTGDALAATDDVFEKARIDLVFNISCFFLLLGLAYYGNLISNHLTWLIYITSIGVISLPLVLIVLKKTKNVRYAGFVFMGEQLAVGLLHQLMMNFHVDTEAAFWTMITIFFAFFILGTRWGLIATVYGILTVFVGIYNEETNFSLFHFNVPKEQLPPHFPYVVFFPMAICVYSVYRMMLSRNVAEQQISEQKKLLQKNNKELGSKNEDIISSINYAKKIQSAVLPNEETIYRSIPLSFIIYKPRDIVSGDFFWFHEADRDTYTIVAADCTGHGVPGAFMTVIGSNALTQTIIENKITKPADILLELDNRVTSTLKQEKTHYGLIQDGMDLALLKINKAKKELIFTSAKRPAFFIRNGELREIKGSKFSIGGLRSETKNFAEVIINYQEDDMIYLCSDGFVDQFGGPNDKKFTTKRLRELLLGIYQLPVSEQKNRITEAFENWKGKNEQTDDMLVIGIRF
jgi:serine phosphatase RsbU (regulator of sigma subunit)